jgi:hypothetical protein
LTQLRWVATNLVLVYLTHTPGFQLTLLLATCLLFQALLVSAQPYKEG